MTEDGHELFVIRQIAQVCHAANRAYCRTIGDYSQPEWEDAPEWQKESAIDGVRYVLEKNGNVVPPEIHAQWLFKKRDDGWKYGAEKDPERKLHPCMVPFRELSMEQRMKDHIFLAIAKHMLYISIPVWGGRP